jgi:PAS domain S-box-containing protein
VLPLIAGVTIAAVALTLYCFSHGISTVFMHLYYLPIILIAYFYRRRGIPVFTGLTFFYLALAAFFLYPSIIEIGTAALRAGMFILIGVVVAELSERLEKKKEDYRVAHEYEKSIISNANVWLMVLDSYGRILEWNLAAEQISGYPAAEVIGGNEVWKRLYPEKNYRKEITGKITEIIKKDNYLENLQTTIISKNGTKKTIVWNTRGLPDSEGIIGNYIAIGVDITDREKVAQVSREYAEWYSTLLRTTRDGYNLVDATGRLIEVNDNYCRMTGFSREELLGRSIYDQDANEEKDVALVHVKRILATGSDRFETRHRTKGGGAIDVEISVVLQAQKKQFIVFVRDITERKRAEKELYLSEEKFHTIADFTADWEYWQGQDKQIIYMSPSCHHITGYTQQEFLADPNLLETIVHPDDLSYMHEHNRVAWESSQSLTADFRIIRRDGTIRWISHACRQVFDKDGKSLGRRGSNRDITDQTIALQALRESEEKFRAFFTTSQDCVFITSVDGRWIDFNNSAVELFGYESRKELLGEKIADFYAHPDERNVHLKIISEQGFTKEYPVDLKKKDGTIINTLVTSVARRDPNGTIIGFQGTIRDITELKRAEMELQELAAVVRYSGELVGIATLEGKITFLNDAGARMLGILPADAIGKDFFRFIPDLLKEKLQTEVLPASMERGIWQGDLQYKNQKSGNLIDVHAMTFTITDPATGKPQFIANVSLDITDRKRADDALRTSQLQLTEAMNLAHMAHWELDVPTGIFTFNDRFYALCGTTKEREGGYQMPAEVYAREFVYPDDLNVVADETNKAIAATDPDFTRQIEHRIIRRDGEVRHIIVRFGITKDAEGRTVKTHGANQDITELKRAEAALTESFATFRTVMDSLDSLVYVADMKTYEILFINQYGRKIWGDLTGGICWKSLQVNQEGPCPFCTNKKIVDSEGNPTGILIWEFRNTITGQWYECHDSAIQWTDGRIVRLEIATDITERKRVEEALRQANKQLNLLSSITRHDILNQLMALKGYLELSHEVIDNPTTLIEYIKKEEQAANTIEHQITFTKDYQELGIAAPEWQNVNASIDKALSGLPMRDVRVDIDPKNPTIFADRLFEKVFYNLIDNALRYGGAGMKTIRVSSTEHDTGLLIVCEDDGVGISAEDKKRLFTRGFGKNTGLGLFLSREILAITGITITENGTPGKGARFEITVPKGAWRMTGNGE